MALLGYDIGVRALLTAQSRLDTIGHNLANASTPGYSRQSVLVSQVGPQNLNGLLQGGGVQADAITRAVDAVLHARLARQDSAIGRLDSSIDALSQAETSLGGLSETGPAKLLEKMFASFASLSTAADDDVRRSSAVQSAVALTSRMNQVSGELASLKQTVAGQLDVAVDRVNVLANHIAAINRQIPGAEAGNAQSNDMRDDRDQAIRELASLIDVRTVEDERGAVRVLVGGRMLVGPTSVSEMSLDHNPVDNSVKLKVGGFEADASGGQIGGYMSMMQDTLPKLTGNLDAFARNLIYQTNAAHAQGMGVDGPFSSLQATTPLKDVDGDGAIDDELLSNAGLPFAIGDGELVINVTDKATGAMETHRLQIDASHTTVADFVNDLNALPHVSAAVDSRGLLRVQADTGYGFDFAPRLDGHPDHLGSFGSGHASLGSAGDGPFSLAPGDTLDFTSPLGTFSVAFQASSFANMGAATSDEIAAVLNGDANFQASGLVANSVGGSLVVQTSGTGANQTFTIAGGTATGALGWSPGQVVNGSDVDVAPTVTGQYTGTSNGALVFRPNMDGTIGTTSGLMVEVFDQAGNKLTELQVGAGYNPGDELDVGDGIKISFGFGQLSASENDVFRLDTIANSDTGGVLPALSLNGLFNGTDASSIAVRSDIVDDPSLLATSNSGAPGDATNLLKLIGVESQRVDDLGGSTVGERLSQIASGLGSDLESANDARSAEQLSLDALQARREQVAGVNTDEELVHMIEQQQAYSAAAQYLHVVDQINTELLNIV